MRLPGWLKYFPRRCGFRKNAFRKESIPTPWRSPYHSWWYRIRSALIPFLIHCVLAAMVLINSNFQTRSQNAGKLCFGWMMEQSAQRLTEQSERLRESAFRSRSEIRLLVWTGWHGRPAGDWHTWWRGTGRRGWAGYSKSVNDFSEWIVAHRSATDCLSMNSWHEWAMELMPCRVGIRMVGWLVGMVDSKQCSIFCHLQRLAGWLLTMSRDKFIIFSFYSYE